MKKPDQLVIGLLGLILLLVGFGVFHAVRVNRLERRLGELEDSARQWQDRYFAFRAARTSAHLTAGLDVLMAPEVATISGRFAQVKAMDIQANSIPVFVTHSLSPSQR